MRKAIPLKLVLAGLVIGAAAIWVVCQRTPGLVTVGGSAPDFVLPSLSRDPIALHDYYGQVVVLNFWATWCPPCVEETPSLEKFFLETRNLRVVVIGVSVDQDRAALEKFVSDYRMSFPIARDPDQRLASRYGTSIFPETYILDRNGKVAEKVIGAIDWQDPRMISFVKALVGSSEPQTP